MKGYISHNRPYQLKRGIHHTYITYGASIGTELTVSS